MTALQAALAGVSGGATGYAQYQRQQKEEQARQQELERQRLRDTLAQSQFDLSKKEFEARFGPEAIKRAEQAQRADIASREKIAGIQAGASGAATRAQMAYERSPEGMRMRAVEFLTRELGETPSEEELSTYLSRLGGRQPARVAGAAEPPPTDRVRGALDSAYGGAGTPPAGRPFFGEQFTAASPSAPVAAATGGRTSAAEVLDEIRRVTSQIRSLTAGGTMGSMAARERAAQNAPLVRRLETELSALQAQYRAFR